MNLPYARDRGGTAYVKVRRGESGSHAGAERFALGVGGLGAAEGTCGKMLKSDRQADRILRKV